MNNLQLGAVISALGWVLVHFLWQASLIAAALAVVLRVLPGSSARARYAAGALALALLMVAPGVTFTESMRWPMPASGIAKEGGLVSAVRAPDGVAADRMQSAKVVTAAERISAWSRRRVESFFPILVGLWGAGVLLLTFRLIIGWQRLRRWQRDILEEPVEPWRESLERLKRRMNVLKPVRLLFSRSVESPCVMGWLRPMILVPAGLIAGFPAEQLELILLHELAHIRRGDYLVNLLQRVVEVLFFYHPAVWWISAKIREERENCCDDAVVAAGSERIRYGRALAALEGWRQEKCGIPASALSAKGGSLLLRIERLVHPAPDSVFGSTWAAVLVMAALIGLAGVAGLTRAHGAVPDTGSTKERKIASANPPGTNALPASGSERVVATNSAAVEVLMEVKLAQLRWGDVKGSSFEELARGITNGSETAIQAGAAEISMDASGRRETNDVLSAETKPTAIVLSSEQFKTLIRKMEKQSGVDILAAPKISTLAGRQAQLRVVESKTVVAGVETNWPSAGVRGGRESGVRYRTETLELGPTVDVWPVLSTNGQSVQLKLAGTLREFLGYDPPGAGIKVLDSNGKELMATPALPRFREWRFDAMEAVPLGETLVLHGIVVSQKLLFKDKVPVLGDIPLLGRLFRSESSGQSSRELVVFVTVRRIR